MVGNKELLCASATKMAAPVIVSWIAKWVNTCLDTMKIRDVKTADANTDSGIMPMVMNPLPEPTQVTINLSPPLTRNVRILAYGHYDDYDQVVNGDYKCVNGQVIFCASTNSDVKISVAWLDDAGNLASDFSPEKTI